MSNSTLKVLATVLGLICALLVVCCVFLMLSNDTMLSQASVAEDYSMEFEKMRLHALQSTVTDHIVSDLFGVLVYSHKHKTASPLDPLVERHRAAVVREIMAHLRRTATEDVFWALLNSPEFVFNH